MPFQLHQVAELSSALLTPTIAVITTYVAVQQYRMARAKRELELYDRRLAIYKNAQHIIDFVARGNGVSQDKFGAWLDSIAEAEFLLGREVMIVLDRLADEVGDHMGVSDPEFEEDPDEAARITLRINSLNGPLKEVFTPYLNLRHIAGYRGRPLSMKSAEALLEANTKQKAEDAQRERYSVDPTGPDEDVPF